METIIQISFSNEKNEGLSGPRKTNLCTESAEVCCKNVTFEEGRNFAKQITDDYDYVDGVFVITDLVAIGVLAYFNEKNIKVPGQIAVIGFGNWFVSEIITPKLSTVE
jgi:DNA-binding LacI/PurR family transcriptional regulator